MWRNAWLIAANDLRRSFRDRSILLQALAAPILIALVVGAAVGSGFSLDITIGVADADASAMSRQIAAGLTGAEAEGITFSRLDDPGGVDAAVDSGDYDAVLVLPAGLGQAVVSGRDARIQVVGRATDAFAQSVAQSVAEGVSANLQTARLTAVAAIRSGVADPGPLVSQAVSTPPPITVDLGEVEGTFSVMAYFAPGIAMLFLFFVIGNGARAIIAERREGTLPRILAAPVQPAAVLLGKTLGVMLVGIVSMTAVWLVTWLGFGAYWGDPLGVLLVIVAAVTAISGISLLIAGLARTDAQADAVTTVVALLFAVAGGTFFYGASPLMATMARFTPNGQALAALVDLAAAQAAVVTVLPRIALLLALGVATAAVGLLTLRKRILT